MTKIAAFTVANLKSPERVERGNVNTATLMTSTSSRDCRLVVMERLVRVKSAGSTLLVGSFMRKGSRSGSQTKHTPSGLMVGGFASG